MGLQLQHVFAGIGMRRGEVQRQPLVDGLAVGIAKRQVVRLARAQVASAQGLHQRGDALAGHAHDAHGAAPRGSGDGNDRVGVAGKHGGDCSGRD